MYSTNDSQKGGPNPQDTLKWKVAQEAKLKKRSSIFDSARAEFSQKIPALMLPKKKTAISDMEELMDEEDEEGEMNISEMGVNEHKFMKRDVQKNLPKMMEFKKSSTNVSKVSSLSKAGSPTKISGAATMKPPMTSKTVGKNSILTMVSGGSYIDS